MFDWIKASAQPAGPAQGRAVTDQQPAGQEGMAQAGTVSEQPRQPESMKMELRGGGEGDDICCGICAGLACFECCECCC